MSSRHLGSNVVSSSTAIISRVPGDDLDATISRSKSGVPRGRETPIDRPRPQGKNPQGWFFYTRTKTTNDRDFIRIAKHCTRQNYLYNGTMDLDFFIYI